MVTRRLCSILVALTMGCAGQAVQQEPVVIPDIAEPEELECRNLSVHTDAEARYRSLLAEEKCLQTRKLSDIERLVSVWEDMISCAEELYVRASFSVSRDAAWHVVRAVNDLSVGDIVSPQEGDVEIRSRVYVLQADAIGYMVH